MTIELLNNVDHHDLRVVARSGADLGDAVNQVLLFPTEFEAAQRHYPIIFRKSAEGPLRPVAILGLAAGENLFLDERDGWRAPYVPAMLARGPFSIAAPEREGEDPMIRVDLSHPRVVRSDGAENAGTDNLKPLFLRHGGKTPYLERMAAVLQTIYVGHGLLDPLVAALEGAGLLRDVNLEARVGENEVYAISQAVTIDRERLAALTGPELEALNRQGFLQSAFFLAASLANLQTLADLKAGRGMGETA